MTIRHILGIAAAALAALPVFAAEQKVKMQDLPPAVQQAAKEQAKNATLLGLSREVEKGKTFYEVETLVNGHTRHITLDSGGAVVEVEEQVALSSIPPAARTALEKTASAGKITEVETVTKCGVTTYEAAILKAGKRNEAAVAADGSPVKE